MQIHLANSFKMRHNTVLYFDSSKRYSIDKMNTIFLTDGSSDGNDRYVTFNPTVDEKELRWLELDEKQ